jgi:hypothetical protein
VAVPDVNAQTNIKRIWQKLWQSTDLPRKRDILSGIAQCKRGDAVLDSLRFAEDDLPLVHDLNRMESPFKKRIMAMLSEVYTRRRRSSTWPLESICAGCGSVDIDVNQDVPNCSVCDAQACESATEDSSED